MAAVTPGISLAEYMMRRQALVNLLPDNSLVIIPGNSPKYMVNDIRFGLLKLPSLVGPLSAHGIGCRRLHMFLCRYPFHQHNDFFYLTGFQEPDATLVLGKSVVFWLLFCGLSTLPLILSLSLSLGLFTLVPEIPKQSGSGTGIGRPKKFVSTIFVPPRDITK